MADSEWKQRAAGLVSVEGNGRAGWHKKPGPQGPNSPPNEMERWACNQNIPNKGGGDTCGGAQQVLPDSHSIRPVICTGKSTPTFVPSGPDRLT